MTTSPHHQTTKPYIQPKHIGPAFYHGPIISMTSFNPFDDYLSAPTAVPKQLPPQHSLPPQHLNVPSRPQPIATMPSNDDFGGFFDSPVSNKNNQSFSDLRKEGGAMDDDWSGFETTEAVDDWSAFSPQKQMKKTGSNLSPRVFAAAKRSSKRRSTNPFSPRGTSGTPPPPQPPQPPQPPHPPPTSPTPSTISFQKKGTPRSTSADNHDAKVDTSKNNKIYQILDKISTFSKHSSKAAQQSVALAYAELEVFVSNPQYRHCDQAIDGLLGVYTTLKQMEHDVGTMDPRLVKAYESLKKLGTVPFSVFPMGQHIFMKIKTKPAPFFLVLSGSFFLLTHTSPSHAIGRATSLDFSTMPNHLRKHSGPTRATRSVRCFQSTSKRNP